MRNTPALQHANEHRAHIYKILGALGHEPPDGSGSERGGAGRQWRGKKDGTHREPSAQSPSRQAPAAYESRAGLTSREYAPNKIPLEPCVPATIVRKLPLQGFLQFCVSRAEHLVSSEHVPEQQVSVPLRVVHSHYMQMMRSDAGGRLLPEEVPPIPAFITSVAIAKVTQRLSALPDHSDGRNRHGNVDNGLGIETEHCGAAYVLDVQGKVPDVPMKGAPFFLEKVVPVGTVGDNLYTASLQADHMSSHIALQGRV